jgi:hypothetical protein
MLRCSMLRFVFCSDFHSAAATAACVSRLMHYVGMQRDEKQKKMWARVGFLLLITVCDPGGACADACVLNETLKVYRTYA